MLLIVGIALKAVLAPEKHEGGTRMLLIVDVNMWTPEYNHRTVAGWCQPPLVPDFHSPFGMTSLANTRNTAPNPNPNPTT
jgi:hypothetical protein